MKWINESNGAFPQRLWFESIEELDTECQRLLEYAFFRRFGRKFTPPLGDEDLQVLIEAYADLDLYASLDDDVEALTDFEPGKRPKIRVNQNITLTEERRNRLRTSLAHEWFHAVYHRDVWEVRWARENLKNQRGKSPSPCRHSTIISAPEDDWLEFQAGYASCAILMPRTFLIEEASLWEKTSLQHSASTLISHVASRFAVSEQAARWRLRLANLLPRESTKQLTMF